MFVKDITPAIFDEILEHETLHLAIHNVYPRMSIKKQHKIIEKILYIRGGWLEP